MCAEALAPFDFLARQLLATRHPSPEWGHVGLDAGLVDEDQLVRIRTALMAFPTLASVLRVWTVALVRDRRSLLEGAA